jgi:hypothetical protein
MHSWITWVLGLIGMSTCLWVLDDIWRLLYLEYLMKIHRTTVQRCVEMRCRVMTRCGYVEDTTIEELSETVVEVVGPFLS